jgi:probable rRNA maturation factor
MPAEKTSLLFRRAGDVPKAELRSFARQLRDRISDGRSFTCLITDDKELERLNRMFLGKSYPTDVLSFPSAEPNALGDIAISVQRASEQADEHGHELRDELRILMLHGVLHLMGMDHEKDRGAMAKAEKRWRTELGLPTGLIERSARRNKRAS